MRDNAIMLSEFISNDELCDDLVGCCGVAEDHDMKGMLVWSNPWEPSGWEVTEGFVRKWGFLMKGCEELKVSTNNWREFRGEEPLVWEL